MVLSNGLFYYCWSIFAVDFIKYTFKHSFAGGAAPF